MKIIAIGGAPGTGKTTLIKKFMADKEWSFHENVKLVPYYKSENLYIIGKYSLTEVFGGTDKMSMACQPEVVKWLDALPKDSIVVFEGDRLFNVSFLTSCLNKFNLSVIILETSKEIRQNRYIERGSNQNETWLNGRITKVNNIRSNFDFIDNTEVFTHDDPEDTKVIIDYMMEIING